MIYWPLIRRALPYFALSLAIFGLWYWTYSAGQADVQAKWNAERAAIAETAAKAEALARERERRQREDYAAAERRLSDEQKRVDSLSASNADLVRRLRDAARRGGRVCPAPGDPGQPAGTAEPAIDAGRASVALAEFAAEWAAIRDAEAARLKELQGVAQLP